MCLSEIKRQQAERAFEKYVNYADNLTQHKELKYVKVPLFRKDKNSGESL